MNEKKTVSQLSQHLKSIEILRHDLSIFVDAHPEISDDFEDIYLRIIGYLIDFEKSIENAINRAEVDF